MQKCWQNFDKKKNEITELCKGVLCVDLGESFQTHIYLQILVWIQPRTSPVKFARSLAVQLRASCERCRDELRAVQVLPERLRRKAGGSRTISPSGSSPSLCSARILIAILF